jgi:hypothetical protein
MGAEFDYRFRSADPFSHQPSAVSYQREGWMGTAKGGRIREQTQDVL